MPEWIEQLEKLAELRDKGILSEDEFQEQKKLLLPPSGTKPTAYQHKQVEESKAEVIESDRSSKPDSNVVAGNDESQDSANDKQLMGTKAEDSESTTKRVIPKKENQAKQVDSFKYRKGRMERIDPTEQPESFNYHEAARKIADEAARKIAEAEAKKLTKGPLTLDEAVGVINKFPARTPFTEKQIVQLLETGIVHAAEQGTNGDWRIPISSLSDLGLVEGSKRKFSKSHFKKTIKFFNSLDSNSNQASKEIDKYKTELIADTEVTFSKSFNAVVKTHEENSVKAAERRRKNSAERKERQRIRQQKWDDAAKARDAEKKRKLAQVMCPACQMRGHCQPSMWQRTRVDKTREGLFGMSATQEEQNWECSNCGHGFTLKGKSGSTIHIFGD